MTSSRRIPATDGVELAVFESGAGAGPTVVLMHGYPDDHTVWDGVAALLGQTMRVVAYDVRGAGASGAPPTRTGYRVEQLVDDVITVLDAVSPDRPVHVVAHDWGSVQAWAAVGDSRLEGRITSFTSLSGPSLDHIGRWLGSVHRHPLASLRQLARSYYTLLFQVPLLPEAAIRAGLIERTIGPRSRADQLHGLELYRANLRRPARRRRPRTIDIPVQVLAPRDDAYILPSTATGAPAPYVGDLRTRVVPGDHWVISARPDVIAGCVRTFIEGAEGGNPG